LGHEVLRGKVEVQDVKEEAVTWEVGARSSCEQEEVAEENRARSSCEQDVKQEEEAEETVQVVIQT